MIDYARPQAPAPSEEPALPAAAGRPEAGGLDGMAVLRSLRRRWFPVLALGVPAAAAAAAAAWYFVPASYTARSEFFIKSYEDQLVFETAENRAKFEIRKQTSQKLVTSQPVLTAALRKPEVAKSPLLSGEPDPIDWLSKNLKVASSGEEFFSLSLAATDPKAAADVVAAVTEAYMIEVVEGEQESRRARLKDLEDVAARAAEELELKRRELKKLIDATNSSTTVMMEQKQDRLLEMHVALRKQLGEVHLELIKAEVERKVRHGADAGAAPASLPDNVVDAYVVQEPEYVKLSDRVEQLRRYARRSRETLAAGHPQIAEADRKLNAAEAELARLREAVRPRVVEGLLAQQNAGKELTDQQLDQKAESLRLLKEELEQDLEKTKVQERETGVLSIDLENLDKEIERREGMVATLAQEVDRRTFELKKPHLSVEVQTKAQVPSRPELTTRIAATGGGAAAAIGLIGALLVLLDLRRRPVSSLKEVSGELSVRVIGSLPAVPRFAMAAAPDSGKRRSQTLFWQQALKESVDAARTLLMTEAERHDLRVIMVGSALSSEGKTTLTCHLATSLARAGRRVAVVDCDLRRPSLDRVFGVEGSAGLSEVLKEEAELADVLTPSDIGGLSVVPAGEADPQTLDLLAGDRLGQIVAELRSGFDFVILDTSPILPVCDALLFARHADCAMLAVRRNVSRLNKISAALQRLSNVGVPVLGAVAIGLDDDPVGYGAYYRDSDRYIGLATRN